MTSITAFESENIMEDDLPKPHFDLKEPDRYAYVRNSLALYKFANLNLTDVRAGERKSTGMGGLGCYCTSNAFEGHRFI